MFYFLAFTRYFLHFYEFKDTFSSLIRMKGKFVSIENFLAFGSVYLTVIIGFGLIYLVFAFNRKTTLNRNGNGQDNDNIFETCFYFSAMTLFSVGNGDVIPHGLGRIITVIEALIGYTLPAAFVARAVFDEGASNAK